MGKTIIITEEQLKYCLLSEYYTDVENDLISLVESGGSISKEYDKQIKDVYFWVQNSFNKDLNKKSNVFSYNIPKHLTRFIYWFKNVDIIVTITNYTNVKDGFQLSGENCNGTSGLIDETKVFDENNNIIGINAGKININTGAIDGIINGQMFMMLMYHEINHLYMLFNKIKNGYSEKLKGNYNHNGFVDIQDGDFDNKLKVFANFCETCLMNIEINARVDSISAELKNINSTKKTYREDLMKTNTFKDYYYYRYTTLPYVNKQNDETWEKYKLFLRKKNTPVNEFKKWFNNLANEKLDDMFRKMNKTASFVYYQLDESTKYKKHNIGNKVMRITEDANNNGLDDEQKNKLINALYNF